MDVGRNREAARRRNLRAVLSHVHRTAGLSRAELTALTGLNRSTIVTLVDELAELGLVVEGDPIGRGTPGRPSPAVEPSPGGPAVLAASVGSDRLELLASGLGGVIGDRHRRDRPPGRRDPEATADDLADLIRAATVDLGGRPVIGIGVAVPGVVNREDGLVHLAPHLGWHDVELVELLAARLGTGAPRILLGNDADLAAAAEHLRGAGAEVADLLYLGGDVGVGGGIVAGGRPFGGATGYAGEVGHLVVEPDGHPCACGGRGCLETQVGLPALLRRLGDPAEPTPEVLARLLADADAGVGEVVEALADVGTWLGRGVASLVNVLNPSRVVLGGLFADGYDHLIEALRRELDVRAQWPNRSVVTVAAAALGRDAQLIGAVELAIGPLLADPAGVAGAVEQGRGPSAG